MRTQSDYIILDEVVKLVSKKTGLSPFAIKNAKENDRLRLAKQQCYYIMNNTYDMSISKIAVLFNLNRNKVYYDYNLYKKNINKTNVKKTDNKKEVKKQKNDNLLDSLLLKKNILNAKMKDYEKIIKELEAIDNLISIIK